MANSNNRVLLLDAVTAATDGNGSRTLEYSKSFLITTGGTVDLSVNIECSFDDATYHTLFTAAYSSATTESYEYNGRYPFYRATVTPYSTGTATVEMSV